VYGPYAFFPLIAACVWLANLLGLIAIWVVDGKPRYSRGNAVVVFISDVGGAHKVGTLFCRGVESADQTEFLHSYVLLYFWFLHSLAFRREVVEAC